MQKTIENKEIIILSVKTAKKDSETSIDIQRIGEFVFGSLIAFHTELVQLLSALDSKRTQGILLILPVSLSAHQATPSPVINRLPIGLLYYQNKEEIPDLINSVKHFDDTHDKEFAVLAMWKNFYLSLGNMIYLNLKNGFSKKGLTVNKWFSDETSRDQLVSLLSERQIGLLIYLGHGRSRGWSGYRGLRWHHLKPKVIDALPIGVIISMTCDNLKFEKDQIPFGVKWVIEKRAHSFFGAVESLKILPLKKICDLLAKIFSTGKINTIGHLIVLLNKEISESSDTEVRESWSKFRLIGNPLIQIGE